MAGLTGLQIVKVVEQYIGVSGGYLGDFSYRSHAEFYPLYCELDFNPNDIEGSTRQRFISILSAANPSDQAKILRGVLERFPVGGNSAPASRTSELRAEILDWIAKLEAAPGVANPAPAITSAVVERAIADAETLIKSSGATSAVDRIHTALHGYLRAICSNASITVPSDASLTLLFKLVREQHPALASQAVRRQDITHVLRALAAIIDALSPVRDRASVAHPNPELLDKPEAMLVVNAARTVIHYLDARLPDLR